MRSVVLVPFCPLPADTGGKVEMLKQLDVLRALGPCTVVSAATKPVGTGWTAETRRALAERGFRIVLREEHQGRSPRMWAGIAYAALGKGLRLERAFGHSNPYHRYAFPAAWWQALTREADLAVIHYSYWAHLPCACAKVVVLMDLWSDFMWEGPRREVADLQDAGRVIVISKDEEMKLNGWGITRTLWSPPAVAPLAAPDSAQVGLVGSGSRVNREGLNWLAAAAPAAGPAVRVYGGLAAYAAGAGFVPVGRYEQDEQPYRECGIILMTTAQGMGVQIKAIEALAAGRAIVARGGAMRGLPPGAGAWIEVDSAAAMRAAARRLAADPAARQEQGRRARAYYDRHLQADTVRASLRREYEALAALRA